MAGSITTLGVGSGIDLQGMLEQLREIDQAVVDRKQEQITVFENKLSEFTTVKNKLYAIKSPALDLSLESTYLDRTVSSSDEDVATATVISGTEPRSSSLNVTQLATSSSWLMGVSESGADLVGGSSATENIYGTAISQSSSQYDDSNTTTALYSGGSITVNYGPTASPTASFTINAAADMTLDDLVTAINNDAANVENGGLGASLNGRLVTASVETTDDGKKYLQIKSDYVGASGEAHQVAAAVTDAHADAALTFAASAKEMTFQLGSTLSTDNALGLGKTFTITYDNSGSPVDISINAADFAAADADTSGYLSFAELAEAINTDSENTAGSGSGHGTYVWATVETDATTGNNYLQVVSDNGGTGRDEKVTISTNDTSLGAESASITSQTVSSLSNTFSVEVNAGDTLTSLKSNINADSDNKGITASVIDDGSLTDSFFLSLTANGVGEDDRIIFPAGQNYFDGLPMHEQNGKNNSLNAIFTMDGINFQREENSFSDVMTGVTMSLEKAGSATITVSNNNTQIKEMIQSLVTAYNEAVQEVSSKSDYDNTTGQFGILADTSLRDLPLTLRNLMTTSIKGDTDNISYEKIDGVLTKKDTNVYTLFDLGLEFNRDGSISLDEDILDSALSTRSEEVEAFFLGDSDRDIKGFADLVNDEMSRLTNGEGQIAGEKNSAQDRINDLETKIEQENARLDKKYELLTKQFIELDRYMNQMTSLSNYLSSQFDSIGNAWSSTSKK